MQYKREHSQNPNNNQKCRLALREIDRACDVQLDITDVLPDLGSYLGIDFRFLTKYKSKQLRTIMKILSIWVRVQMYHKLDFLSRTIVFFFIWRHWFSSLLKGKKSFYEYAVLIRNLSLLVLRAWCSDFRYKSCLHIETDLREKRLLFLGNTGVKNLVI